MNDTERIQDLGRKEAMMEAAGLSLYERYVELAKEGLRLTDVNYENCVSDPDSDTVIPVRPSEAQST